MAMFLKNQQSLMTVCPCLGLDHQMLSLLSQATLALGSLDHWALSPYILTLYLHL